MVVAVKLRMVEIGALLLIAAAAIIGVIALSTGHWVVVASMVLTVLGQGLTFRKARAARRAEAVTKSA
jgi:CHASE2 domain-containing sensor protein